MPSDHAPRVGHHRRLHPSSLLFSVGSVLRRFLIPGLIVLFAGRGENYEIWAMVFAVPAIAYAVVKYVSLRYRLGEAELIIREGILHRTERHIPYQRIQNIDTTRTIFHRVFGVADVIVQTASGTKPEAVLRVLSDVEARAMRARVFAGRDAPAGPAAESTPADGRAPVFGVAPAATGPSPFAVAPAEHTIVRAGVGDLVRFGLISNRGMLAVAAVMGIAWQLDLMPSEVDFQGVVERVLGVRNWSLAGGIAVGVVVVLAAFVALRILSVAWAVLALYDFTLARRGEELRTRFGLLTQRAATIPRHRIQLIEISSTLLHRWFDRVAIRARTAGAAQRDEAGTSRDWLTPILERRRIASLLGEVQPELDFANVDWQPIAPKAARRMFVRAVLLLAVPGIVLAVQFPLWGAAAWLVILPAAWLFAHLSARFTAYALGTQAVWFRHGWLTRTCRMVRYSKIQAVTCVETSFDRRHRMASIRIDTANAGAGQHAIAIPYLGLEVAKDIYERLGTSAAEAEFRW